MSGVVKFFKKVVKIGIWIVPVVIAVILLIENRNLRKDREKDQNTIKNYEQQYLGLGKDSVEENPEAESGEIVEEETEYSAEEIQRIIQKLYDVEKRVEVIEKGKQNSTTTVQSETAAETVEEVNVEESVKAYLSRKYPFNGNYYKEAGECQYYSDTFCTQKIDSQNLRFMSQTTDYAVAENGLSITCLLTDNWQIVYCTQSPYLITEAEYQEMHYQK